MTSFGVALEITPPREDRPDVLLRRARLLGRCADAVHVIQRPGRQPSLDASLVLERAGIAAVWHVTNRGRARAELELEIERAAGEGLRAALVVRGEGGAADREDTPTLRALVARIGAAIPGARIGVTLNPYLDPERALANLWPKLEAGAAFIQTQPVFELASLRAVAERIRVRAPAVAILPMVIPLLSAAAAEKLALRLRLPLPASFVERLARGREAAGWRLFSEAVRELRASGLADGVAVMTQEMDPPAAFGDQVRAALERSAACAPT
ncbi:MAG: methylenetetrahydrofolate reductase [Myxococcota bacterium]